MANNGLHSWTDTRDALLRQLHAEGHSFRKIADRINRETGSTFSKNACIGKCSRQGLDRGRSGPNNGGFKKSYRPKITAGMKTGGQHVLARRIQARAKALLETRQQAEENIVGVSILELTGFTCRWPIGDPGAADFVYCGAVIEEDRPYCPFHANRAFVRKPQTDPRSPGVLKPPSSIEQSAGP